jgi:ATP-dependent protease ClpP protease subunit
MPNWNQVLHEIHEEHQKGNPSPLDYVRRKYLTKIYEKTGRNIIAYYSGWLQKPTSADAAINDKDKSAFMTNIHGLDRSKGLDLILHTPGGDVAATESIIDYLRTMFDGDIRAIIPQISMSGGTMIALSCRQIMMGKQSNLGPIDPQLAGVACQAVLDEFELAKKEIKQNPHSAILWQTIISKYHPTLLIACQQSIEWATKIAKEALAKNMHSKDTSKIGKILEVFANHSMQKSHARHISVSECKEAGLSIVEMEIDNDLQDLILTTHHAFMHSFANSPAIKIVENQLGTAYVETMSVPPTNQ